MEPKLIATFDRLSEADFLAKARHIIASMTGNVSYPEPWMPQVPSLAQLYDALNVYRDAYHEAFSKNPHDVAQRDTARQTLTHLLRRLVPYLEALAEGDKRVLMSTGYELDHDTAHGSDNISISMLPDFRDVYSYEARLG